MQAVRLLQRSVGNQAVQALFRAHSQRDISRAERLGQSHPGSQLGLVVQRLNKKQKQTFRDWANQNVNALKTSLKLGDNRSEDAKVSNYLQVREYLALNNLPVKPRDIEEAVEIIKQATGRPLEIQAAPRPVDSAKVLSEALEGASDVMITYNDIDVYLDNDQLKHQPKDHPIGTRQKGGGNKFKPDYASPEWHRQNTLVHMGEWAESLGDMREGQKIFHGQSTPVNGIHYEGYCLFAQERKYVLFHCYPADGSDMKM